ncbi:MAG: SRPBCC family protein [Anaerolineae bacterium]|nr:SRPBCC family protein [Anaerolineae bacterium]
MVTVKRSSVIQAPAEIIFRYLNEPSKLHNIYQPLIRVSDELRTLKTTRFNWEVQLLGVHFVGVADLTEVTPQREVHLQFWGGIEGNIWLRLHPSDQGTEVEVEYAYEVPAPLLHKHGQQEVIQYNIVHIEGLLTTLKQVVEEKMHLYPH